jgi:hypothetical protein
MSINWWRDKTMTQPYNWILGSNKMGWTIDTQSHHDESQVPHQVQEARTRKLHTFIWYSEKDISLKINKLVAARKWRYGKGLIRKEHEGILWVTEMFCILIMVVVKLTTCICQSTQSYSSLEDEFYSMQIVPQ